MENFKISELYEKIERYKIDLTTFYKIFVIMSVRLGKYDIVYKNMPQLRPVTEILFSEGILFRLNEVLSLNVKNYSRSIYKKILEEEENIMDFETVFKKISGIWRGKKGAGSNGHKYMLFDQTRARVVLLEFIEENPDIKGDIIVKANEEFFAQSETTGDGDYKAAPKCSTFITGSEKNGYLIEYCHNIMNRQTLQSNLRKSFSDDVYGGFGTDI